MVILKKDKINHDCYIYSLGWVDKKITFTISQHFRIIQTLKTYDHPEGEELVRKYTPINPCSQTVPFHITQDTIDMLVKIYRPNTHPDFPHGGKITPFLENREVGDKLLIEAPFGQFGYEGNGTVVLSNNIYI